jgi:hypothetical protein
MLTRLVLAVLVLPALTFVSGPDRAFAEGGCPADRSPVKVKQGVVCVVVTDPGEKPDPVDPTASDDTDEVPAGCFTSHATKVPCRTPLGQWWSGRQCYAAPYDAPPGTSAWHGHTDGSLFACTKCKDAADSNSCIVDVVWLAPGESPGPPDPGELATTAVGLLRLAQADVHTAPHPPDPTYIGVENWLWVPGEQWQTLRKTVSAGGISVTVAAVPEQVVWDLGPRSETCYAAGAVWRDGMTDAANTSCSYAYDVTSEAHADDVFPIRATIRYRVSWTCSGACSSVSGSLGLVDAPAGTGAMRVLQRQTVVVR